jgi:protein-tyrosine phosphatase
VQPDDFGRFDYLLGLADEHARWLRREAPPEHAHKIGLLLDYAPHVGRRDVPDPYYGSKEGFEVVLDLIEQGAEGLLAALRRELTRRAKP